MVESLKYLPELESSCVALGFFDGIHTAHASVIRAAFTDVGESTPVVLSVGERGGIAGTLLLPEETERQLELLGTQVHILPDFATVKSMSGEQFVNEILVNKLHARRVSCGFNYRFGAGAVCDADALRSLCGSAGIECVVIPQVTCGGEVISATAIRRALESGDAAKAAVLLGRRWGYELPVSDGQHLGRRLGMPTINQIMPQGLLLPKFGVYASVTYVRGLWHSSVTNIGVRPTVGAPSPVSETWLNACSENLYGELARVELVDFIRPEIKFSSLEELKNNIHRDAETAVSMTSELAESLNRAK